MLCDYIENGIVTLEHDAAEHWRKCSICHQEESRTPHIWILKNGIYVCSFCGVAQQSVINKIKLPIALLTE